MSSIVSMQHVSKRFHKTQALDDVSLEVPPGSVCALLGANGAGKTTAIRTLLGLEKPDSGRTEVLGMESVKYSREIRSRVGYVAEKPALYDWMTIAETGWFAAGFYPPGYQSSFEQYTRQFHLDPSHKISQLSKGTRSKVALALALAHQPALLILDEPTSGLDPLIRREFLESMVDVASQNRSVLLCSHQVNEVERVADLVAILIEGKLVCFERLDDLKRSTWEVTLTQTDSTAEVPAMPGTVIAHFPRGREHHLIVRDLDEQELSEMKTAGLIAAVRRPNLEDILLLLLRAKRPKLDLGETVPV
ncbi:ABC transporter ATP-binding protein [Planctomicrobium sp. SH527]|uniref:ABC transporter ATP-binding protein n=1 Tax=Planctomicrobium sp. SH527 TaxID=3448123 RepID=UPI003F5BE14A